MDTLPPELLLMIVRYVKHDPKLTRPESGATVFHDLKSLRLTCKTLADIVTPSLFQEHYVGLFDKSLANFVALSKHPVIHKLVKQINFVGDVLPKLKNQKEWEEDIDLRPRSWEYIEQYVAERLHKLPSYHILKSSWQSLKPMDTPDYENLRTEANDAYHALPRHELNVRDLHLHWREYINHSQQQEAWGEAEDQKFIEAFARLPNLYHAYNTLSDLCHDMSDPPLPSVRKAILTFETEARHDDLWTERLVHMKHAKCLLQAIEFRANHMKPGYTSITDVNISNYGEQAFGIPIPPEPMPGWTSLPNDVHLTFAGFEHLTQLDLDISHFLPSNEDLDFIGGLNGGAPQLHARGEALVSEVRAMLTRLDKVVDLRLRFYPSGPGNLHLVDSSRDMLGMLGPLVYPHLKFLELSITTTRETLLGFLCRHSKTLRELNLEMCDLIGDNPCWESVISQLPRKLSLEKIHFESLAENGGEPLFSVFNEEHQKLVEGWVLNGGKLVPAMTKEELVAKYGDWINIEVVANLDAGELPELEEQIIMDASDDGGVAGSDEENWDSDDVEAEEGNDPGGMRAESTHPTQSEMIYPQLV